jgi:hypothetical protein
MRDRTEQGGSRMYKAVRDHTRYMGPFIMDRPRWGRLQWKDASALWLFTAGFMSRAALFLLAYMAFDVSLAEFTELRDGDSYVAFAKAMTGDVGELLRSIPPASFPWLSRSYCVGPFDWALFGSRRCIGELVVCGIGRSLNNKIVRGPAIGLGERHIDTKLLDVFSCCHDRTKPIVVYYARTDRFEGWLDRASRAGVGVCGNNPPDGLLCRAWRNGSACHGAEVDTGNFIGRCRSRCGWRRFYGDVLVPWRCSSQPSRIQRGIRWPTVWMALRISHHDPAAIAGGNVEGYLHLEPRRNDAVRLRSALAALDRHVAQGRRRRNVNRRSGLAIGEHALFVVCRPHLGVSRISSIRRASVARDAAGL